MKGTIKAGLSRTYALRQYENIKPMVEIEIEFDTEKEKDFDMQKTLEALKIKCEDYINKFNPESQELPF
jgi:hypothetical protein